MDALLAELRSGRINAALDVTDPVEPLPPEHELRRLPNVLLTPHVAAGGIAWVQVAGDADRLGAWLGGAELPVRVEDAAPPGLRAVGLGSGAIVR